MSPFLANLENILSAAEHLSSDELAKDNDFWEKIRATYKLKPDYINLESGFYCLLPEDTLEHFITHVREVNYQGSYYMRNFRIKNKEIVTAKLPTWRDVLQMN